MHPAWFRIGGVAHDLPRGWDKLLRELLDWLPKRLDSYVTTALKNTILKGRSIGVAAYTKEEALAWGLLVLVYVRQVLILTCVNGVRIQATKTLSLIFLLLTTVTVMTV